MARGGINKAVVQMARKALLARGENPSIDAVRVELGNTGSKTTIHRYMKELEQADPRAADSRERLSDELSTLVAQLLDRLMEEGGEAVLQAQARFDEQQASLEATLADVRSEMAALQRQYDSQQAVLQAQTGELHTCNSSLQSEITRNARLSQNCVDLEVRVVEKDEQIRSLEDKHQHAREALEHYRNAVKDQREQEQRRHEGQLQQLQVELRQLQQVQAVKQEELTRLNRDNERLLGEARQQARHISVQEDALQRLGGEIDSLKTIAAKTDGAREVLQEQVVHLRQETKTLSESLAKAEAQEAETRQSLEQAQAQLLVISQARESAAPDA